MQIIQRMKFIYQLYEWPNFKWESDQILHLLASNINSTTPSTYRSEFTDPQIG